MKCPFCGKHNATIHLTQITNGKKQDVHICEHCAQEKGILETPFFNITQLTEQLAAADSETPLPDDIKDSVDAPLKNPAVVAALTHFKEHGKFRSPDDYQLLHQHLAPMLKKIHGGDKHTGKRPAKHQRDILALRLQRLKAELDAAVREEFFEKAAALRNDILRLEDEQRSRSDG
jgi:protein arginine kinase activator